MRWRPAALGIIRCTPFWRATEAAQNAVNPQIKWVSYALWLLFQVAMPLGAEEQDSRTQDNGDTLADPLVSISLTDGTQLEGVIIQETENHILVETLSGLEIKVPRTSIITIKRHRAGAFSRPDPNYTRLLFAPTGRPLRRGDAYFFNHYVFFPGMAYGLTDHFSLAAGLSVIPGLGLSEQVLSLAPRFGLYDSGDVALSAGVLYMKVADEGAGGMAFVVGTKGTPAKSFTCGIGLGYIAEEGEDVDFAEHPVLLLGGNIRLSESMALVSENWFITGEDLGLDQQPLGLALRFFGPRIAVDAGVIIIGEVIEEGFPIPWLSFVYNFDD